MSKVNPKMTELQMDRMRRDAGFIESQAIDQIVYMLNGTSDSVKKITINVDPLAIHIPVWQRDIDWNRVNAIADNFDELMFETPKCIFNNGRLEVVEGQHRVLAMAKRRCNGIAGSAMISIEVLKCDEHKARELFLLQGVGRKNPTPADIWRAEIYNGNELYLDVRHICKNNNFAIAYDDNKPHNPIGTLVTVGDYTGTVVRRTPKFSTEILDKTLKLLTRLGWCANEKNRKVKTGLLRSIANLYTHTKEENHGIMEDALVRTLGGAVNFERKLATEYRGAWFDIMRAAINTYAADTIVFEKLENAA